MNQKFLTEREREDYYNHVDEEYRDYTPKQTGAFRWITCVISALCGMGILVGVIRLIVLLSAWIIKIWHVYFNR
jgi:hypothetical protein